MNFREAVKHGFQHYADFKGKANRSEFWFFFLFTMVTLYAVPVLLEVLQKVLKDALDGHLLLVILMWMVVLTCGTIVLAIPTLAVAVRRLHDTEQTGHRLWLLAIPVIGAFIVGALLAKKSKETSGDVAVNSETAAEPDAEIRAHNDNVAAEIGLAEAVKQGFQHYADFKGKASRSEFWFFYLFTATLTLLSWWLPNLLLNSFADEVGSLESFVDFWLGWAIVTMFALAVSTILAIPTLAAAARRLEDIGRSKNDLWLLLIPVAGALVIGVALCRAGKKAEKTADPSATDEDTTGTI